MSGWQSGIFSLTYKPVMVGVVSSIPTGGNLLIFTETPQCKFCTEMPDLCSKQKPRMRTILLNELSDYERKAIF